MEEVEERSDQKLIDEFVQKLSFSREELYDFYRRDEPDLKASTFSWRIYDLRHRNVIKPVGRGVYVLSAKPNYAPKATSGLMKVIRQSTAWLSQAQHCYWETSWLNEFSNHQASQNVIVLEVERGLEDSLFHSFRDAGHKDVFLDPDEKGFNLYVSGSQRPLVIRRLNTKAPLIIQKEGNLEFHSPSLEKLLVDLFSEDLVLGHLKGPETLHIFENAFSAYHLNFTTLLSYAKRRNRDKEIRQYIQQNLVHKLKHMMNDQGRLF